MGKLAGFGEDVPDGSCLEHYNQHVVVTDSQVVQLLHETMMDRVLWLKERRHRITGRTCYPLFTYRKDDWETKVQLMVCSSFKGKTQTLGMGATRKNKLVLRT